LGDASWVVPGQDIYIAGAGGPGQAGWLQVQSKTGNQLTLLNPVPPPSSPPLASATTPGLMAQTDGIASHFIGGDNATHVMPIASPSISGDLNTLSGVATQFVGGDNACHPHSTIALDTLGAPTDITALNATASAHGLLAKVSGLTTDYIRGDNSSQNLANVVTTFFAITSMSAQGPWPKSVSFNVPFKADLLVNTTVSAYTSTAGALTAAIQLDGVTGYNSSNYFNPITTHESWSSSGVWRAVTAGTHTLGVVLSGTGANSDSGASLWFGVLMIRVP